MLLRQGGNLNYMESPLQSGDRMFTDFVGFPLSAPTTRNSHTKAMASSLYELHIIKFIMERHVYLKTLPLFYYQYLPDVDIKSQFSFQI